MTSSLLPSLKAADLILAKFDVSSPHRDSSDIRHKISEIIAQETNCNISSSESDLKELLREAQDLLHQKTDMWDLPATKLILKIKKVLENE